MHDGNGSICILKWDHLGYCVFTMEAGEEGSLCGPDVAIIRHFLAMMKSLSSCDRNQLSTRRCRWVVIVESL